MIWESEHRIALLESRTAEFAVDPIFGVQACLNVYVPKLAIPTAEVAAAFPAKYQGIAARTSGTWPSGCARASRSAGWPPTSRSGRRWPSWMHGWPSRSRTTRC